MVKSNYSSDKPIVNQTEDAFSRSGFAKRLATTIKEQDLSDGYVIGLYSQWGYGKTSTLNMIEQELVTDKSVEIIKFNPWLFTDHQAMIQGLFSSITESVGANLKNKTEKFGDLIGNYSKLFAPSPLPGTADAAAAIGKILSNASMDELKARVNDALLKSGKRLVIIIDDVDRLDKDELFTLFKIIKIGVDFKQIVYLISFDDKVVSEALNERYIGSTESGQSFIEKIIQVPLHLPMIEENALNHYVLSRLDGVLDGFGLEINQEEVNRFRSVFDRYIAGNLGTPRMANRYLNSLKFVIPLTDGEINPVDLLLLEAFRLIFPDEYKLIRKMKKTLSGTGREMFMGKEDARKKTSEELVSTFSNNRHMIGFIEELFPVAENAMKEHGQSYVDTKQLSRDKRAASPDYFDRYFTYGIPLGDVSDVAIQDAINSGTVNDIASKLQALINAYSQKVVIDKLRTYEKDITNGENLAIAVAKISSVIDEPVAKGFEDTPLEESAKMMLVLATQLPKAHIVPAVKRIINEITNLDQLSYFIRWIDIETNEKRDKKLFSRKERASIIAAAVVKIKNEDKKQPIFRYQGKVAIYNYHTWAENNGKEEVSKQFKKTIKTASDVADFLTSYASVWYGNGAPKRGKLEGHTFEYMTKIVDVDYLYSIISKKKSLANVSKMVDFPSGSNVVGNESNAQFRETLLKQFSYLYNTRKTSDEQSKA